MTGLPALVAITLAGLSFGVLLAIGLEVLLGRIHDRRDRGGW